MPQAHPSPRMGPDSFQWCPVTGQRAMGTNWGTGSSVWTWGRTFSLWEWWSTGTGCPGRWWSLLLWRYSRPAWTRSYAACCRRPCFGRGVGLDDPQRSLPTSTILWFCEKHHSCPLHCSCPQICRDVSKQCHPVLGCNKDISSNSSSLTRCTQIFLLQRNLSSFWPASQIQFLRTIHPFGPLPREKLSCEQGEVFWQLLHQGCHITRWPSDDQSGHPTATQVALWWHACLHIHSGDRG